MTEHEKHKHRKTGIVIMIAAILVLIMHMYIFSALLFLLGIIVIITPLRINAFHLDGTDTEDNNFNCENCEHRCDKQNCSELSNDFNNADVDSDNVIETLQYENDEIKSEIETEPEVQVESETKIDDMFEAGKNDDK